MMSEVRDFVLDSLDEVLPTQGRPELSRLLEQATEANAWLRMAERVGQVGHWRVSLPDQTLTWSDEIYRIHGVSRDSYSPTVQTAIEFYHPEDRGLVEASMAASARDSSPFEFSLRLITAGGQTRHVHSRGLAIPGPDGAASLIFGVFLDISEQRRIEMSLREANAQLDREAHLDALTGLANRRLFDKTLEASWCQAIEDGTKLSVVMLDIDRFKGFNDRYGHLAGDECLRAVANAMACVRRRPDDFVARYGGEELALILPSTDAAGAEQIASQARSTIQALGLVHEGNVSCGAVVTASFGIATAQPLPGAAASGWIALVAQADRMLYEAKRTGRNTLVSALSFERARTERASIERARIGALPAQEEARLAALARYGRAGATRRTSEFDRIAKLAATLANAPIGLVSLLEREDVRFAGSFGLGDAGQVPRAVSFCNETILGDQPFVIADTTRDPRYADNILVTGEMALRYYAGAPIVCRSTGHRLGAVCVIDRVAREQTSAAQRAMLCDLSDMVASLLDDIARQQQSE